MIARRFKVNIRSVHGFTAAGLSSDSKKNANLALSKTDFMKKEELLPKAKTHVFENWKQNLPKKRCAGTKQNKLITNN
jgi:hypothetical protein